MINVDRLIDDIDDHDYGEWPEGPSAGELGRFAKEAQEAMYEFVKRCDEGSIRSTRTYNKFKDVLRMI